MPKFTTFYRNLTALVATVYFLLASEAAFAKRFASQYCEFELPLGWECTLEGSEWVCQSSDSERQREAIIILAVKVRGEQDSLADYQTYLKQVKTFALPGGKSQVSEPKYTEQKQINNHAWVDSLHLASEVPGFYTRYLATVKENLGVAVTFSVAKDFYDVYQGLFDKTVATLKVFAQEKADLANFRLKRAEDKTFEQATFVPDNQKFDISQTQGAKQAPSEGSDDFTLYAIIGGIAVAGYFMLSKKGKGKPKKKG
jgi:hypothetical protein